MDSRLVLIYGPEIALRQRVLGAIIAAATEDGDFDLETMHATESTPDMWIAAASTIPFLSSRRTVIVRMLAKSNLETEQILAAGDQLVNLPESARLVLVGDEDPGDDQPATIRTWSSMISKIGRAENCSVGKDKVAELIREESSSRGKKMLPSAVNLLVEMCGGSFSGSLEELDKLALYVGDSESITEKDVTAVVVPSREWRIYSIIGSVLARNVREALILLRTILGSARKLEDTAFSRIFPPFSNQLRMVWQARVVLDLGGNKASASAQVRSMLPATGSILDEQGWRVDQAYRLAKRTTITHLARCFDALARADARIKGIRDDEISTEETLERMIAEMCEDGA